MQQEQLQFSHSSLESKSSVSSVNFAPGHEADKEVVLPLSSEAASGHVNIEFGPAPSAAIVVEDLCHKYLQGMSKISIIHRSLKENIARPPLAAINDLDLPSSKRKRLHLLDTHVISLAMEPPSSTPPKKVARKSFSAERQQTSSSEYHEDQSKAIVPYKRNPSILLLQFLAQRSTWVSDNLGVGSVELSKSSVSKYSTASALPPLPPKEKRGNKIPNSGCRLRLKAQPSDQCPQRWI